MKQADFLFFSSLGDTEIVMKLSFVAWHWKELGNIKGELLNYSQITFHIRMYFFNFF